ncbi:PIN domain-containing protein [Dissulfurispira sp.]|uniref:PIN domain-containing protein n=1 Tax=Dissulfurispira sp. TaxID=2817609 RepID=UPI002FD96CB5
MKLILDTGILISALIKESSINRHVLLMPIFDFYLPEYAVDEINRHKEKIAELSGLTKDELTVLFSILLERVTIVTSEIVKPYIKKAEGLIGHRDKKDVTFVALALAIENDGIWTNDKDFSAVSGIKVWNTKDILDYLSANH